jgi:CRISPR-associated protein Cas5d
VKQPDLEPIKPIPETRELGWMLYDMDYSIPNNIKPMFFRAKMVNGVIEIPDENSEEVRK